MPPKKKSTIKTVATSQITKEISEKFEALPKKITKGILLAFLETIEKNLAAGNKVRIDKLGILNVKDRAARKGRNPQTGEEIQIPASKKVSFRVSSSLKDAVGIKKKKVTTKPKSTTAKKKKK